MVLLLALLLAVEGAADAGVAEPPKKVRSWKDAAKELHAPAAEVLPDVLVYGAEWCGPCHKLRAWLTGQEINFGYVDIEKNTAGRRRLMQLKKQQHIEGGSIPVVEIKGTLYVGFHRDELEPALDALPKSKP
ncbi:MAG TPA: glutaredoxin family protein [Myxococcales bacterium]|jgi:glutaredoxin|nr:glutaredoxin family protein [Myxococcales bacterium]